MCQTARRPSASPPFGRPGLADGRQAKVSKCAHLTPSATNFSRKSAAVVAPANPPSALLLRSAISDFNISRSEEHTSELQSLMRISYAVFCLKKKTQHHNNTYTQSYTT